MCIQNTWEECKRKMFEKSERIRLVIQAPMPNLMGMK